MSHDTKTGCTDRQGHAEISAVPFALRTDAKRDRTLNEPERSFPPTSSPVPATCASDTDDGDYETSSEGMIRSKRSGTEICRQQAKKSLGVYLKEKSASLSKRATLDGNISAIKRGVPFDSLRELMENGLTQKITNVHGSLTLMSENLAQSKSLPILKSDLPKDVSGDFTAADVALMSASSFARKRKMSMIVKKMVPLISPYPSTASLTTGATANFRDQRHEGRRLTSGTKLSILSDATPMTVINDARSEELVAEVTLHETKNNRHTMNWDPARDAISTFVNDEGAANLTNDGDLVDFARNPYSSIKSVYFSPNLLDPSVWPDNFGKHQRMSTDVEALRKIDDELAPLRCQYSEIIGKARALSLSGTGLDLGIHYHLDWSNTLGQYTLSPNVSDYFPDRSQTHLRRVTTSCSIENRPVRLVDKTTPSTISSFSMVDKPTQRDSHTSWLNDSTRRQEALSLAIRDSSRTLESFQVDGLRSSSQSRVRNNISHVPASDSHAFQGENVLGDRSCNRCFSNSNFQPYRKSEAVIERATSTWNGWFVRGTIDASPSNVLGRTEYNSHRYLNRTVRDSRTSTNDFIEVRRQKSSVSIVEVIDNNCPIADDGAANKRSRERNEIPSSDQNSTMVEMEFTAGRGGDCHKSILPETERVVEDEQISSPFALKSIERDDAAGPDCRIPRAASACPPQIRVVSVNTEFRTTVEKRYTSRAVSPIQHSHSATASSTTAPRNNLLATKVLASTFVQQVHADSSKEVTKIKSSTEMRSIDPRKRGALANAASRCDFCVGKVDSRSAAETLPRLPESGKDNTDPTTTGLGEARYLRLPRTKEKTITIVPIVLTDRDSPRSANVDFAIPRYADNAVPKLSYQIAPFDARKFRETSPSFIRADESSRRGIRDPMYLAEEFAGEKRWRTSGISASHVNRNLRAEDDYSPATTSSVTKNPKRLVRVATPNARKRREYRESAGQRVAKMIPGMRSTPEDFLCET